MALPAPEPGLVLCYSYLWHREESRGGAEGRKDRPAVIVIVRRREADGAEIVTVLPITHSPPRPGQEAIKLPPGVKRAAGLDAEDSWVVVDEANDFLWPGYDLRPVADGSGRFHFGYIPPRFYEVIRERLLDVYRARKMKLVPRSR